MEPGGTAAVEDVGGDEGRPGGSGVGDDHLGGGDGAGVGDDDGVDQFRALADGVGVIGFGDGEGGVAGLHRADVAAGEAGGGWAGRSREELGRGRREGLGPCGGPDDEGQARGAAWGQARPQADAVAGEPGERAALSGQESTHEPGCSTIVQDLRVVENGVRRRCLGEQHGLAGRIGDGKGDGQHAAGVRKGDGAQDER